MDISIAGRKERNEKATTTADIIVSSNTCARRK